MLAELNIRNLVLFERQRLVFEPGLTAISGTTGAGKSLVLSALRFALGARASQDLIRPGAPDASVEALFYVDAPEERAGLAAILGDPPGLDDGSVLDRLGAHAGALRDIVALLPAALPLAEQLDDQEACLRDLAYACRRLSDGIDHDEARLAQLGDRLSVYAAHHLAVTKAIEGGKTYTAVRTVEGQPRVQELAQMLRGDRMTASTLREARQMVETARRGNE